MAYCAAALRREQRHEAWRCYTAELLRLCTNHAGSLCGGGCVDMTYWEILHPGPEDDRTGDEIAAEVIRRAGLVVM